MNESVVPCWSETGSVELENGVAIGPDTREDLWISIEYEILLRSRGMSERRLLKRPVKVLLNPIVTRNYRYFPDLYGKEEIIFPPSSHGFYSRLYTLDIEKSYDNETTICVQCSTHRCLDNNEKLWLVISDMESGQIYEAFLIPQYEGNIFTLVEDVHSNFAITKRYAAGIDKSKIFNVEGFLKSSPPTYGQLGKILGDVSVPNLKIYDTLGDTMLQLIPKEFPESIRKSLCVFLGLLALDRIKHEDPDDVSIKFAPWRIIDSLYNSHLLYTIQKIRPPSYVRLMHLAARKQLQGIGRPMSEDVRKSRWLTFWDLLHDGVRNFQDDEMTILLDIIERSNQSCKISGENIPSKSAGQRSQEARMTRLICSSSVTSPCLVCAPNLESLGLHQALYVGSAYGWPHRHMSYITRLASSFDYILHLQHMILPSKSYSQIRRVIPSMLYVNWSTMTFNPDLYLHTVGWNVESKAILESLSQTRPLNTLRKKYHDLSSCNVNHITPTEALVMDLITRAFHMMYLKERPYLFERMFGIEKRIFLYTARSLVERGIVEPQYILIPRLPTLATITFGKPKSIISLADAFLSSTPTCTAYICNEGSHAVFLSRMPPSDLIELAHSLPEAGKENGITIRCFRPDILRTYNRSLFQRLLREDGTWDDDVSGFLSQARSKRIEFANVIESVSRRDSIT